MAIGKKTGGRRPGSRNKVPSAQAKEIAASGLTPLDYLLKILRNTKADPHARLEAAKAAAPYVHPRLAPIPANSGHDEEHVPLAERLKEYSRVDAIKASEGKVVEIGKSRGK